jgi:hypothetical protein
MTRDVAEHDYLVNQEALELLKKIVTVVSDEST